MPEVPCLLLFAPTGHQEAAALLAILSAQGLRCESCSQVGQGFIRLVRKDPGLPPVTLALILDQVSGLSAPALAKALRGLPGHARLPLLVTDPQMPAMPQCRVLPSPLDPAQVVCLAMQSPGEWPSSEALTPAEPPQETPERSRSNCILIVDDNEVNRRILHRQVSNLGLPAEVFADAVSALERIAGGGIALVLMDCQMPGLDGYEATRRIRSLESGTDRHLPIIAVTAHALAENRRLCQEAGMDDFLAKPVSHDHLLESIEYWIGTTIRRNVPKASENRDAVLDREQLRLIDQSEPGLGKTIATLVLDDLVQSLRDLSRLRELGLRKEAGQLAHRLRGSVGSIGAIELTEACGRLEQAALHEAGDGWQDTIPGILEAEERFRTALLACVEALG